MNTAESELVGYCEATTMLKSAEGLLKVIHGPCAVDEVFEKMIYGDNSSAVSILMNPDGAWRTRHLRLRSSYLGELLKSEPQNWKVRHQRELTYLRTCSLWVAATSAAVGGQMKAACAAAAGALAIWLAANWDANPSIEGRPNVVCKDGWGGKKTQEPLA